MKFAVIGSATDQDVTYIRDILSTYDITGLISGNLSVPDRIARRYAIDTRIPVLHTDYGALSKPTPHLLNIQIVRFADYLLAFCDSVSIETRHTVDYARRYGVPVDVYVQHEDGKWALEY